MKEIIINSIFNDNYIHPSLIYKLVKEGKLDLYINKLDNNKLDKNNYNNFIMVIDNFIDYLDCSLNINHVLLSNILDIIFSKETNEIFLTKHCIKSNREIHKIKMEYKKIILKPFRSNLKFVINYDSELKRTFKKFNVNIDDDKSLFNFLIDSSLVRKNHQYLLFDDYNEYINKNIVFYIYMWKILFDKLNEYYNN